MPNQDPPIKVPRDLRLKLTEKGWTDAKISAYESDLNEMYKKDPRAAINDLTYARSYYLKTFGEREQIDRNLLQANEKAVKQYEQTHVEGESPNPSAVAPLLNTISGIVPALTTRVPWMVDLANQGRKIVNENSSVLKDLDRLMGEDPNSKDRLADRVGQFAQDITDVVNGYWDRHFRLEENGQAKNIFNEDGSLSLKGVGGAAMQMVGQLGTLMATKKAGLGKSNQWMVSYAQSLQLGYDGLKDSGLTRDQLGLIVPIYAGIETMTEVVGGEWVMKILGVGEKQAGSIVRKMSQEAWAEEIKGLGRNVTEESFKDLIEKKTAKVFSQLSNPSQIKKLLAAGGAESVEEMFVPILQKGVTDFLNQYTKTGENKVLFDEKTFNRTGNYIGGDDVLTDTVVGGTLGFLLGGGAGVGLSPFQNTRLQQQTLFAKLDHDINSALKKGVNIFDEQGNVTPEALAQLPAGKLLGKLQQSGKLSPQDMAAITPVIQRMAGVSTTLSRAGISDPKARYALYDIRATQDGFEGQFQKEVVEKQQQLAQLQDATEADQLFLKGRLERENLPAKERLGQQIREKIKEYALKMADPDQSQKAVDAYRSDLDGMINQFQALSQPRRTLFEESELEGQISRVVRDKGGNVYGLRQVPGGTPEAVRVNRKVDNERPKALLKHNDFTGRVEGIEPAYSGDIRITFSALDNQDTAFHQKVLNELQNNPDAEEYTTFRERALQSEVDEVDALLELKKDEESRYNKLIQAAKENRVDPDEVANNARARRMVDEALRQKAFAGDNAYSPFNYITDLLDGQKIKTALGKMDAQTFEALPTEVQGVLAQQLSEAVFAGEGSQRQQILDNIDTLLTQLAEQQNESESSGLPATLGAAAEFNAEIEPITEIATEVNDGLNAAVEQLAADDAATELTPQQEAGLFGLYEQGTELAGVINTLHQRGPLGEDSLAAGDGGGTIEDTSADTEPAVDETVVQPTYSLDEAADIALRMVEEMELARQVPVGEHDAKEAIIAEMVDKARTGGISRDSYVQDGDENHIDGAIARSYLNNKTGSPIDVIAQEASLRSGTEVSVQDIIDFTRKYPSGIGGPGSVSERTYYGANNGRREVESLKTAFRNVTGMEPTDENVGRVLERFQQYEEEQEYIAQFGISREEWEHMALYEQTATSEEINSIFTGDTNQQEYEEQEGNRPGDSDSPGIEAPGFVSEPTTGEGAAAISDAAPAAGEPQLQSVADIPDITPEQRELVEGMTTRLKRAFPNVELVVDGAEYQQVLGNSGTGEFSSKKGVVLGFVHEGKVYLNPDTLNPNTAIHEYGHVWNAVAKQQFSALYKRGLDLMKGTRYEKAVRANPAYTGLSEEGILEEALAQAIGDKGEKILTQSKRQSFVQWLKELWTRIKSAAGIRGKSVEEVQNMTLEEFTEGVVAYLLSGKPVSEISSAELAAGKEKDKYQIIGEMGAQFSSEKLQALEVARQMEADGKSRHAIYLATGWERGSGDKWRFDLGVTPTLKQGWVWSDVLEVEEKTTIRLGDLVSLGEIAEAHPDLSDLLVVIEPAESSYIAAYQNPYSLAEGGEQIFLNANVLRGKSPKEIESALAHEIQHAIQEREGFAVGGAPSSEYTYWPEEDALRKEESKIIKGLKSLKRLKPDESTSQQRQQLIERYLQVSQQLSRLLESSFDSYERLSGEVEARNVQTRMSLSPAQRRRTPIGRTEDVARKDQIFRPRFAGLQKLVSKGFNPTRTIEDSARVTLEIARPKEGVLPLTKKLRTLSVSDGMKHINDTFKGFAQDIFDYYETNPEAKKSLVYNRLTKARNEGPFSKEAPGTLWDSDSEEFNSVVLEELARHLRDGRPLKNEPAKKLKELLVGGKLLGDWKRLNERELFVDADGNRHAFTAEGIQKETVGHLKSIAEAGGRVGTLFNKFVQSNIGTNLLLPETFGRMLGKKGSAIHKILTEWRRGWLEKANSVLLHREDQQRDLVNEYKTISSFDGRTIRGNVKTMQVEVVTDAMGGTTKMDLPVADVIDQIGAHLTLMTQYKDSSYLWMEGRKPGEWGGFYQENDNVAPVDIMYTEAEIARILGELETTYRGAWFKTIAAYNEHPELVDTLAEAYLEVEGEEMQRVHYDYSMRKFYYPIQAHNPNHEADPRIIHNGMVENSRIVQDRVSLPQRVLNIDALKRFERYVNMEHHYIADAATVRNLINFQNAARPELERVPVYGKKFMNYLDKLITDMNNPLDRFKGVDMEETMLGFKVDFRSLMARYTKAVFSFNPGIPLKQVVTYSQGYGLGIIENKHLNAAFGTVADLTGLAYNIKKGTELGQREKEYVDEMRANRHLSTTVLRMIGRNEAYLGGVTADNLLENYSEAWRQGLRKSLNTVQEYGMGWIRRTDRAVIIGFYEAAKSQVQEEISTGKLEAQSLTDEAAQRRVAQLTDDIVYATNQMYSEGDKTQLQRDAGQIKSIISLYTGQQQKLVNTWMQSIVDYLELKGSGAPAEEIEAARERMKWIGINNIVINAILMAVITSIVGLAKEALLGDEESMEKRMADAPTDMAANFAEGVVGSFPSIQSNVVKAGVNIMLGQPFGRDIVAAEQFNAISDIMEGGMQFGKAMAGGADGQQLARAFKTTSQGLALTTGFPLQIQQILALWAKKGVENGEL